MAIEAVAPTKPPSPGPGYTWNGTSWVPPKAAAPTAPPPSPAAAAPPPAVAPPPPAPKPALEGDVQNFYQQQVQGGMSGNDPITQSALSDFDANASKARRQQIEDLQRFGVIGNGVSAGGAADVLGEFDSGIQRGRSATRSGSIQNILNSVMPQAAGFASDQANRQQQGQSVWTAVVPAGAAVR
jgi:hypothetical protein